MFLNYILNCNDNDTIKKVFRAQENECSSTVKDDLKCLGLDRYTVEEIGSKKKIKLKQLVKNACRVAAFQYLQSDIKNKDMTKLKNLKYKKLEMQGYHKSQQISLKKKKILFKARTRMLNVKNNFGDKSPCPLCNMKEDNQSQLFGGKRQALLTVSKICPSFVQAFIKL